MTTIAAWNPPPPAESLVPSWVLLPWHVMLTGGLMLAAAIVLAILGQWKKRQRRTTPTQPTAAAAWQQAMADLDALASPADPAELSAILRQFLLAAYNEPALFETTEESRQREQAFAAIPEDQRASLVELLARLSEQIYAPTSPGGDDLASEVRALLVTLQPRPQA